jgi:branched-chain amino acid transport system substrate-binding protein
VKTAALAFAFALLALAAAGCGSKKAATPVEGPTCTDLVYGGNGKPDAIIVSDLPRRGPARATSSLMEDAIKLVLARRGYRAGDLRIGYQACNDTVSDEPYDQGLCERNANTYAAAGDVIGVIGPWNSGCAAVELPVLSRKKAGPLPMISPSNTYTGLTRKAMDSPNSPGIYYPDGLRNYVRVVPPDNEEGRGVALLASRLGAKSVVSVSQRGVYGQGLSGPFLDEARAHGLRAKDFEWGRETTFSPLARRIARREPEVVYLAGLPSLNGRRLIEDLRHGLGRDVVLVGSAGWFGPRPAELGPAGQGMLIAFAGVPSEKLPATGKAFMRSFGKPAYVAREGYGAPEAAQSAEVLLDAIARSDGKRASVVDELFKTDVKDGILGSFRFDRNGDIDPAAVGFLRVEDGKLVVDRVVRVPAPSE